MLKKTIVLFFLSISAHANFDLTLGAAARSWPSLGPEVNLESGYNFVFWGEGNKRNPLYGLIRPSFIIRSAAVINSLDARFEFYPISFISLALGHKYINSNWDRFNFYDCKKVRCKGEIHRDYLEFKMAMSFSGITTVGKILMSRNS